MCDTPAGLVVDEFRKKSVFTTCAATLMTFAFAPPAHARDLALYGGTQLAGATAYGALPCNAEEGLTTIGASGGVDLISAPLDRLSLQMRGDIAYGFAEEALASQCLLPVVTTTEVSHFLVHAGPAVRFAAYGPLSVTVAAQAGAAFADYDSPVDVSETYLSFQVPVAVEAPLVGGVSLSVRYRPVGMRIDGDMEFVHIVEGGVKIRF